MAHKLAQHATRTGARVDISTTYPTLQAGALEQGRTGGFPPPSPWKKAQIGKFTHSFG